MEQSERSSEISMQELAALVETAGGQAVGMMIQNRPTPDPRSFIGDGKVAELKEFIEMNNCDLAVFDNELSPSQMPGTRRGAWGQGARPLGAYPRYFRPARTDARGSASG